MILYYLEKKKEGSLLFFFLSNIDSSFIFWTNFQEKKKVGHKFLDVKRKRKSRRKDANLYKALRPII